MTLVNVWACLLVGAMAVLVGASLYVVVKMILDGFWDAEGFDRVALGVVFAILCGAGMALLGVICGFVMMLLEAG